MSPASPTSKILEKEGPQPRQIPPTQYRRGDTREREEPPRAQTRRHWGKGCWFQIFLGWVLCVLLKKTQNC